MRRLFEQLSVTAALTCASVLAGGMLPTALAAPATVATGTVATDEEEEQQKGPTEEEVEAAVARVEKALDEGSFEDKVKALIEVRGVHHADVVKAVEKAIKDDAKEVRVAAIESLGYLRVDSALKELTSLTRKKKFTEDEDTAVALYKAIGRHGDKKSLKVLEDDILNSTEAVLRTRILSIARVRHDDSVEALIGIMNKIRGRDGGGKGGPGERKENIPHMQQFRLALHVLTGADAGLDRRDWQSWWNDNKHDLDVTEEYPELDKGLEGQWLSFWGEKAENDGRRERDEGREEPGEEEPGEEPGA